MCLDSSVGSERVALLAALTQAGHVWRPQQLAPGAQGAAAPPAYGAARPPYGQQYGAQQYSVQARPALAPPPPRVPTEEERAVLPRKARL